MEKQHHKGEKTEDKKELGESIVRILTTDIPSNKNLYVGLTKIKGVSWAVSKALCHILKLDKKRKVSSLSKDEIAAIGDFLKAMKLPNHLYNRKKDFETGKSGHLIGTDLDLAKEFDIKRLKKIRSYKGLRHATGQPVRGQRTKSHFRKNRLMKGKGGKK